MYIVQSMSLVFVVVLLLMIQSSNVLRGFTIIAIFLIFGVAMFQRIQLFDQVGKDIYAYERAITDLLNGVNPYIWTLESFSNPDDPGNHGYAYLPGLLYTQTALYVVHLYSLIPFQYLWKIPVLLADLGVGIFLIKSLLKKSPLATVFSLLVWFFNPYFYFKHNYVFTDPIPIFFTFLSLYYLKKDDVLAGVFYAIAVIFKTFPIILLPIFLIKTAKSKSLTKFVLAGALVGLFFSLPFLGSIEDLKTYLTGALFVHGDRFIQGRPFLFYISYFYNVELFQIIPFKVYTYLSVFFGWILLILFYFILKVRDKYILALVAFLNFYAFTPVLNRTYLMWFLPVLIMGLYRFIEILIKRRNSSRTKHYNFYYLYYVLLAGFWLFNYWYLAQWKDGFHIWRPLP